MSAPNAELPVVQDSTADSSKRPRQEDEAEAQAEAGPQSKKPRDDDSQPAAPTYTRLPADVPPAVSRLGLKPQLPVLPPSLEFVTGKKANLSLTGGFVGEAEVGIIGYVGDSAFSGVKGVIKQRFTDFLVNEITLGGEILHLKEIGKPQELSAEDKEKEEEEKQKQEEEEKQKEKEQEKNKEALKEEAVEVDLPAELQFEPHDHWTTATTVALRPYLSDETIAALHDLFIKGKLARPSLDSGWGPRRAVQDQKTNDEEDAMNQTTPPPSQGRQRGRGRGGGRGGRGGGRDGGEREVVNDTREVLSQVINEREARGATHIAIREVLKGMFDSTARETEQGQRIALKWSYARPGQGRKVKPMRSKTLPYIHFTLHKTNRETQDCLGHVSRMIGVNTRDLGVCGTKDKRAVTVQRVSLKRNGHTLQSIWSAMNGVKAGRRTEEAAVEERGERGTRIGDLRYAHKHLALGMLKGNHFTIVLRNATADKMEDVDAAMASIRDRGFINYFGMQRFGTSTVPTHVTGLFLLQQKWGEAIDSILSLREGEHPDCAAARLAWLEDKDVAKALELMPRRAVAERALWEHWRKGNRVEDKLGALGCIPRSLRTMYVHAYQSYIWNLVATARINLSRTGPLVGDLVFEDGGDDEEVDPRQAESSSSRDVKELTEADLPNYSLTDVILPLPGWNVEYPSGSIRKLYEESLTADALNPDRMRRDQREYSLPGSYRKLIHKPANVSWEHIRYTDPDLPLAQCDEDRILGVNEAAKDDPEGKFRALKIEWTLGTSCYATMALREITRQETATWNQINLTVGNEDQAHKGGAAAQEEKRE